MPELRNMLEEGERWHADKQREFTANWIYYLRLQSSIKIRATKGRSTFDVFDSNNQLTSVMTTDFIIHASDLVIDGIAEQPKPGDRIVVGDLHEGRVYDVGAISNQDVWRWADDTHIRFRIHTKDGGEFPESLA